MHDALLKYELSKVAAEYRFHCSIVFRVYNPYFYNNCQIYWALISSCLSSIRVQTDKILFYASFQQFNVNQWDFIDFLKKPIKKRGNAIDNVRVILN